LSSPAYGCILFAAVLVNFFVLLLEQFVKTDFELLSISYVVSCLFLMCMHILIQENERKQQLLRSQFEQKLRDMSAEAVTPEKADTGEETTLLVVFLEKLKGLTPKEREIYDCYLSGMTTKEIMEKLAITENTLKYHNKNLYSKLGVSSRKELERIGRSVRL
jgi:DNA-binding CsgD family transcriptional regulator